ncbi:MAG: N-6 DNA methylase [Vulcanibacillus sp.]
MQSQNFYRHGVFGVEYLGMIKKMAAVNLYIRGLNPRNIEQGDSLNKFGTSIMPNSKTVILANPPFGAETDQTSYPNVWEDYSTEKETTILFVKLMLDSLQVGGRCAVIVSEGFLTWDQTSAKTLREKLLVEANLKAVIGLPQGVFVSKSGVGPKTSILLFEKGGPTTQTWFYQVQDDGYTMGTNRKTKPNSQLIDALEIYHTYIKQGLTPPEKKNSFVIDASWIKSLDPRIKKRIRQEVEATSGIKQQNEIEKKTSTLFRKVESKQIPEKEMKFELKQAEDLWESKTEAEITQKINKAYSFSYNPSTYHSTLTDTQLKEWRKIIDKKEPEDIDTLDKRYMELYISELDDAFPVLSKFNLLSAIEADIVREYVSNFVSKEALEHYPKLKNTDAIFKMGAKYPMVKLAPYLIENTEKVKPNRFADVRWRTLGVSNDVGVFLNENLSPEETNQSYYMVKKNEFCYNPYRVNVGSIGLNKFDYDNQIISGAYVVFGTKEDELLPEYLEILIEHKQFNDYVAIKANVGNGVRMNFTFEDIGNWEIPFPNLDEQKSIVESIKKDLVIVKGCSELIENYEISDEYFNKYEMVRFEELLSSPLKNGVNFESEQMGKGTYVVNIKDLYTNGYVDVNHLERVEISSKIVENNKLNNNDILFVRSSVKKEGVGVAALFNYFEINEPVIYSGFIIKASVDENKINPKLLVYYLKSSAIRKFILKDVSPVTITNIGQGKIKSIPIPIINNEEQLSILTKIEEEIKTINGLNNIKNKKEIDIAHRIKLIWSEEE